MVVNGVSTAKERADEAKKLLEWGFRNFERTRIEQPSQVIREVPVGAGPQEFVKAEVREPVYYAHPKGETPNLTVEVKPTPGLAFPVARSAEVGSVVFRDGSGWKFEAPLYAVEDANASSRVSLGSLGSSGPATVLIACLLGGGALWMRRKARAMV